MPLIANQCLPAVTLVMGNCVLLLCWGTAGREPQEPPFPTEPEVWASGSSSPAALFCHPQPSPIKKERSPRPQSFCHSSSISPQDKLSLPGFSTPRDKQRLSYGAFTNQIFVSTSTDSPTSPTAEAPPLPPRNAGKGTDLEEGSPPPSSKLAVCAALR